MRLAVVVSLVLLAGARPARAHELRPALLALTEIGGGGGDRLYDVVWRVPIEAAVTEAPVPVFPPEAARLPGESRAREGDAVVERFRLRVPDGLAGKTLTMRFGAGSGSEVLVRIGTSEGRTITGRIAAGPPERARFVVPATPTRLAVAATYLKLGVEHILTGIDHLAFVLGLLLLTPLWRTLWRTVTAFTIAHSLTLALAALGLVHVPQAPVEAVIALSIVLVAREAWLLAAGQGAASARNGQTNRPWLIAFVFGTLHGLGFAGALSEVGLPETDIPLALFSFNVGVELGQLGFVALALAARALLAPGLARLSPTWRLRWRLAPAFVIGSLAMFWCFQRVSAF